MAVTRQGLTLEEFLALPEEKPALEYIDGVIRQKVAPQYERSVLQRQLTLQWEGWLAPRRLGHVFPELRVSFAGRSHVPDLSVFRRERLPPRTRGRRLGELRTPPDLVVEIRSPGQSRTDLAALCHWYVDHRVTVALLVADRDETIHVFRREVAVAEQRRGDTLVPEDVVPGLRLVVDEVFAALDAD